MPATRAIAKASNACNARGAPRRGAPTALHGILAGPMKIVFAAILALAPAVAGALGMGESDARHLLNRTGFGATEAEVQEFAALERGQFQLYQGGWGGSPSGYNVHAQLHGRQPQRVNIAQFADADYDRAADRFLRAGSEADEVDAARTMNDVRRTLMPQLPLYFRLESDYVHPWVSGYRPFVFSSYWKYLDVDVAKRRRAGTKE